MIVYLDASALVKRYVAEAGTPEVAALVRDSEALGTTVISRAEVAAALGKAARTKLLAQERAAAALSAFADDWNDLIRLQLGEAIVARAAALAWDRGMRGYDAVHLASALFWYESLNEPIALATYDRELWRGAKASGLVPWPSAMP